MNTAELFKHGDTQVVRLPPEFMFEGTEIYIRRIGRNVILIPKDDPWKTFVNSLDKFTDDFMAERRQPRLEDREGF